MRKKRSVKKKVFARKSRSAPKAFFASVVFPALLFVSILFSGCVHSKTQMELAETYYNLGNTYSELEEWKKAGEAYLRAMELDPSYKRVGFQMARVYVQAGEYGKAEESLKSLLEDDPDNQKIREHLAWVYVQSTEKEKARELYEQVLEEDPADCDVRYNLALLAKEDEQWAEVEEKLKPCIEYGSADGDTYRLLGEAALEQEKESAVGYLKKAFDKEPSDTGLAGKLALAYRKNEAFAEAVEIYDKLIEKSENEGDAAPYRYKKAELYFTAIEDYDRGVESLRAALEEGYRDNEAFARLLDTPDLLDLERIRSVFEEYGITPSSENKDSDEEKEEAAPGEK